MATRQDHSRCGHSVSEDRAQADVVTAPQGRATVDVATEPPVRATVDVATVIKGRATADVDTVPQQCGHCATRQSHSRSGQCVSKDRATLDVATAPQGRAMRKVATECHIMQSHRCGHHEPHDRPTQMTIEPTVAT